MRRALYLGVPLLLVACSDGATNTIKRSDAGAHADAAAHDTGVTLLDSGSPAEDAGPLADAEGADAAPDGGATAPDAAAGDATADGGADGAILDAGVDAGVDAGGGADGGTQGCGDVTFRYTSASAQSVIVTGSFANWTTSTSMGAVAMQNDGSGNWSASVTLRPGRWEYKFVVDGNNWVSDPNNPNQTQDGYHNSIIEVCTGPIFQVTSHQTTGQAFTASIAYNGSGSAAQAAATLDHQPTAPGALTSQGSVLSVNLTGLSNGIHDLRVTIGQDSTMLKIYVNESTDWRDAALYFVMTDRFVNGSAANDAPLGNGLAPLNDYMGGDFAGVTQKIQAGYFDDLGISALWLTWPLENTNNIMSGPYQTFNGCNQTGNATARFAGYHGYWPSSNTDIESHFGTLQELQGLVDAAHQHGIRILLDFTANHVHQDHPYYSAHSDWFNQPPTMCRDGHWDDGQRRSCWFDTFLPDWNYLNATARSTELDDMVKIVKDTGADGLRVDALKHIEDVFITELRRRTHAEFEQTGIDFYMVGETFTGDTGLINYYVNPSMMHGQFDFPTNMAIGNGLALDQMGLRAMHSAVRGAKAAYGGSIGLMSTFAGNHDIARFVSKASGDLPCGWWSQGPDQSRAYSSPPGQPSGEDPYLRVFLAETYAFTVPGIPLLYYGDEVGLAGAGDPDNRRMLPADAQLDGHQTALRTKMQRLGRARANNAVLRTGDWTDALWADDTLLVFGRTLGSSKAIIAINRGDARTVSVSVGSIGLSDGQHLASQLGDQASTLTVASGSVSVSVPRLGAEIWVSN